VSGRQTAPTFEEKFKVPERHGRIARIALRQRSNDHPMVMFAMLVSVAFVSMALMVPASSAVPTAPDGAPAKLADQLGRAEKGDRLLRSGMDHACQSQVWGAESEACLLAMAKESGKAQPRKIRMIANAEPLTTTPNIF
jgi:hypothetical protein